MILLIFLFILLAGTLIALVFSVNGLWQTLRTGLPYVTTPNWAIDWLSSNLALKDSDVVYEIGSGDARVISALAKKFPNTKFIGVEIQWWPHLLALWRTRGQKNVRVVRDDIYRRVVSDATLVYGFYITIFMEKLEHKLAVELKPGTQVVSFGFSFPGRTPVQKIPPPAGQKGSQILFYTF